MRKGGIRAGGVDERRRGLRRGWPSVMSLGDRYGKVEKIEGQRFQEIVGWEEGEERG